MKKHSLLLFTGIAILFGACSNDEIIPEQEPPGASSGSTPQLTATVDQTPVTRSGVVEGNDYTTGEKFYWTNGDATTVLFRNPSMTYPTQYKGIDYAASVAGGVKSNSCTFDVIQAESIEDGAYTAYGLFPAAAWDLRANYSSFLEANIPAYQTQNEANSTHLGAYMLMRAQNDVTVDGSNPINLSYKHLASVLRFAVWNNSSNSNLKLENINVKLASGKAVFATKAKLADIDATSLTITSYSKVPSLTLELIGDAQSFSSKDGKNQCESYMAVMPTDAFESSDNLIIELSFTDGVNKYITTKTYNIGTDLAFLSLGIEEGKSYYFQLKVDSGDLTPITGISYAIGDYWPNSTNPEGIVFWVKPSSFGTQGKVVGLEETYISQWGVINNDEDVAGVVGIRSLTNGATATKSMIAQYKTSLTFSTDYPAFHYIYNTVNSGNESVVWYLPARDELKTLFAGYSGKVYEAIVNWSSGTMPDYNSPDCIAARSAFDAKLKAKGGAAFGESGNSVSWWYLSSSERAESTCYSLFFEDGTYSSDRKDYDANIRWIREY